MSSQDSSFDLSELSVQDLHVLIKNANARIALLQKTAKRDALVKLNEVAKDHGFSSVHDILGANSASESGLTSKKSTKTVEPKYRNPENEDQTWTGRGKKPLWVTAFISEGRSIDECLIDSEKAAA